MSERIYAVVLKNGQVDAWSTDQGPPSMPYVHEWEVQSEIDSLQVEIERLKEELKEAEDSGFKRGMLHAADMAEDEADGFTRYYYAEYQCLMELSDKLRKEVQGE